MFMDEKYYIAEVDKFPDTIYCYHGAMGETLIPSHQHDKGQFLYTEGGIVYVKTPVATYYLPARHYLWIPPGVDHSIHPSSEKVIMRNIYMPVEANDDVFYKELAIYPVNDLIMQLIVFSEKWKGDILPGQEDFTIVMAFKYILKQSANIKLPLALPYPKEERLQAIIQFLYENLHTKILLPDIALKFNISIRSLTRLFSKYLHMSFVEYLTILRMLKALELLIETHKSVAEISIIVGYNSVPTFSNIFQKMIGIRPVTYRLMHTVL
jgi:AraC-like DNA-binding protein